MYLLSVSASWQLYICANHIQQSFKRAGEDLDDGDVRTALTKLKSDYTLISLTVGKFNCSDRTSIQIIKMKQN